MSVLRYQEVIIKKDENSLEDIIDFIDMVRKKELKNG